MMPLLAIALGALSLQYGYESSAMGVSNTLNVSAHRVVGSANYSGVQSPVCWRAGSLSAGHAKILPQSSAIRLSTLFGEGTCVDAENRMYGWTENTEGSFISPFPKSHRWTINTANAVTTSTWPWANGYTGKVTGCNDGLSPYLNSPRAIGGTNNYAGPTQNAFDYITTVFVPTSAYQTQPNIDLNLGLGSYDEGIDINNNREAIGHVNNTSGIGHRAWYATWNSTAANFGTTQYISSGTTYAQTARSINEGGYITGNIDGTSTTGAAAYLAYHATVQSTIQPDLPAVYAATLTNKKMALAEGLGINSSNTVVGFGYGWNKPKTGPETVDTDDTFGFVWDTVAGTAGVPSFIWDGLTNPIYSVRIQRITSISDDGFVCGDVEIAFEPNEIDTNPTTYRGAFVARL